MLPDTDVNAYYGALLPTAALRAATSLTSDEFAKLEPSFSRQKEASDLLFKHLHSELLGRLPPAQKARLLSASTSVAAGFIEALPVHGLGLRLTPRELNLAIGLRLGVPLINPDRVCNIRKCRAPLDVHGYHCISCKSGGHVAKRHNRLVAVLARFVDSTPGLKQAKEQKLSLSSSAVPGDLLIRGSLRCAEDYLDVTVVNPACASELKSGTATHALKAATNAEKQKITKYKDEFIKFYKVKELEPRFCPLAFECFGAWGRRARLYFKKLSNTKAVSSSLPFRDTLRTLSQQLSVSLQAANAGMIAQRRG